MTDTLILFFICILLAFSIFKIYIFIVNSQYSKTDNIDDSQDSIIEQINRYREQKQTVNAFNLAKKYISENPKSEKARLMYAQVLMDITKYYDAIGHLNILIKRNDKNIDALQLIAECFVKTKQTKKAMLTYKQILALDSNNTNAIMRLAYQYNITGEKRTSIAMYKKLISLTEDRNEQLDIRLKIINMYLELKDWNYIIKETGEVLETDPSNKTILSYMKKAYFAKHDIKNTIETIKKIIIIEPYQLSNYEEIIPLLFQVNELDELVKYAKEALELNGSNKAFIINYLSKAYIKSNRIEEAFELLNKTIQNDHKNIDLQKTMAELYCAKNNYEAAIEIFARLMEVIHPSEIPDIKLSLSTVYYRYGLYYLNFDNYTEAFNKFNKAIEFDSSNPELYLTLAETNYRIKNYSDAAKNFKTAIEINPKNVNCYLKLANMYYEIGNLLEAKKYYLETALLEPTCVIAHTTLGIIYAKQQDPQNAISQFTKALELEPQNYDIRYNLALAYEISNNLPKAIEEYNKVLAINPDHIESKNNLHLLQNMY